MDFLDFPRYNDEFLGGSSWLSSPIRSRVFLLCFEAQLLSGGTNDNVNYFQALFSECSTAVIKAFFAAI